MRLGLAAGPAVELTPEERATLERSPGLLSVAINVIKHVRDRTGCSLHAAKIAVDAVRFGELPK